MSAIDAVVSRPTEVEQRERPIGLVGAGLHGGVDRSTVPTPSS